jgi:predicted MFS family arabinose efflux permease
MEQSGLNKNQVILMAAAAGASVANIYYNQPILKDIAAAFHTNETQVGATSVLSQVGYGLGLFFVIPLGDKVNRKRLILLLLALLSATLVFITASKTIAAVWLASAAIGIFSVSAQVILPMAATLDKVTTGKTVGSIFSGIIIGILSARVFSGIIANHLGWRYVYGISAGLILLIIALLYRYLPNVNSEFKGNYGKLLQSTLLQVKRFSLLRQAAAISALVFGVFSSFWTTLTFHLSSAPFHYGADKIGLFGIVAIGGALLAPVFGKWADKGNAVRSLVTASSLIIVSLLLVHFFHFSVIAFVAATFLLDVGVSATHVTNIARIYTLDPSSHSRINTIYMTMCFIGGAVGTSTALLCWKLGGWHLVTLQMTAWAVLALLIIVGNYYYQKQMIIIAQKLGE